MSINMFKKKPTIKSSSESSYTSDEVSGDYVTEKSRDVIVQDTESLWDCRDRMFLSVRKIKTKDQVEKEVDKDKINMQLEEALITVEVIVEFQTDITTENLKVNVSSQTNNQPIVITFKSTADRSQQTSTESCIKRVTKKAILPPVITPQSNEWDKSRISMEEYSNSIVHKPCKQQTSKFPKYAINRILSPSYCSNCMCHSCSCYENMMPIHKIGYAVMVLANQVLKTRLWLEGCLQYTDNQAVTQRSEIHFRLSSVAAETKYLARELTFLGIDMNHSTGTVDQVEILIDIYDKCFRRFKKIMKSVRWIEMSWSKGNDDNKDYGSLSMTDQN
ncbi:uncharacterized protein LOC112597135 [Melanaphis sacchari]|uniref:uncharacterized protein LOC112597135 n=1 Tax=Melanaphis sacchari TaxID=742174 RepID=UPI000DC13AF8|nr:uncharacterized protein LOC112597135 [Melanaphis sacchari]